ncbi:transporter family-2 protein [Paenibacillus turicensis]|uniref:Transporter family-2 protein n=1 Tax=Paenibacillus turicensis TaxID=160487 RepID=A0ABS4FMA2_9BACL|nr:DMT family transporter [Paenibacillus turicensis]MBP1903716.1 transporter family-2 protein [Paenibacillus turicensis]
MFFALFGIAIGIGLAMQTAVNSQLRKFVISPFLASMISFAIGCIFLTAATLLNGSSLGVPLHVFTDEPLWIWIGGLLGVVALTTNILLFPKLGSVQTSVMPILGMIMMSMVIDHFGFFRSPKQPFSMNRVWGVILVLLGVFLAVALGEILQYRRYKQLVKEQATKPEKTSINSRSESGQWLWRFIGIGSGMLMATQAAINGQLGKVLHSPIHAAFISFFVGLVILIFIVLIKDRSMTNLVQPIKLSAPWWVWIGGILGAVYVLGNAFLVGEIGTGQTVMLALFGQITGSLLVEQFGLLRSNRIKVRPIQILGLIIMLSGVFLIKML